MAAEKPLWKYWLNLAEVTLEEAVCLSLDFEPSILDVLEERYIPVNIADTVNRFRVHFVSRRDAARTHIRARNLKARYNSPKGKYFVSLADFRNWGASLPHPFTFPDEFPLPPPKVAPAEPALVIDNANNKPLNPKREKTLLRIIRALDALAELPERGAAKEVVAKLQGLGFRSPDDDTIRDVIGEARKLEPD